MYQSFIHQMVRSLVWDNPRYIQMYRWREYVLVVAGAKDHAYKQLLSLKCCLMKNWTTEHIIFLSFHVLICIFFVYGKTVFVGQTLGVIGGTAHISAIFNTFNPSWSRDHNCSYLITSDQFCKTSQARSVNLHINSNL